MTYPLFGRGPDGVLDIGFGGMTEDYDLVAVCFWDHQRQPFYQCGIDDVSAQDIAVAINRSRGGEVGFVPMSSARSFSIEAGSANQREQVAEGIRPFAFSDKSPAFHRLSGDDQRLLRNLTVVAAEDSAGRITPFTNMLTHQWRDDCEQRYSEAGRFHDACRIHFYVVNSYDSINIRPADIRV